jgi:hypothetical protein
LLIGNVVVAGILLGPKREEDISWRKLHNDELQSCILHQILLGYLSQGR